MSCPTWAAGLEAKAGRVHQASRNVRMALTGGRSAFLAYLVMAMMNLSQLDSSEVLWTRATERHSMSWSRMTETSLSAQWSLFIAHRAQDDCGMPTTSLWWRDYLALPYNEAPATSCKSRNGCLIRTRCVIPYKRYEAACVRLTAHLETPDRNG